MSKLSTVLNVHGVQDPRERALARLLCSGVRDLHELAALLGGTERVVKWRQRLLFARCGVANADAFVQRMKLELPRDHAEPVVATEVAGLACSGAARRETQTLLRDN